jgi:hypothetical protein
MTTPPKPLSDDELREEISKIHGRLHGRQITHKQVAVQSHWPMGDLQSVLIEDEYLFIDEIVQLHKTQAALRESEADRKSLETIASLLNGDYNQVDVVKGYIHNKLEMYAQEGKKDL